MPLTMIEAIEPLALILVAIRVAVNATPISPPSLCDQENATAEQLESTPKLLSATNSFSVPFFCFPLPSHSPRPGRCLPPTVPCTSSHYDTSRSPCREIYHLQTRHDTRSCPCLSASLWTARHAPTSHPLQHRRRTWLCTRASCTGESDAALGCAQTCT